MLTEVMALRGSRRVSASFEPWALRFPFTQCVGGEDAARVHGCPLALRVGRPGPGTAVQRGSSAAPPAGPGGAQLSLGMGLVLLCGCLHAAGLQPTGSPAACRGWTVAGALEGSWTRLHAIQTHTKLLASWLHAWSCSLPGGQALELCSCLLAVWCGMTLAAGARCE
jgi:hypothetical protein